MWLESGLPLFHERLTGAGRSKGSRGRGGGKRRLRRWREGRELGAERGRGRRRGRAEAVPPFSRRTRGRAPMLPTSPITASRPPVGGAATRRGSRRGRRRGRRLRGARSDARPRRGTPSGRALPAGDLSACDRAEAGDGGALGDGEPGVVLGAGPGDENQPPARPQGGRRRKAATGSAEHRSEARGGVACGLPLEADLAEGGLRRS